MGNTSYRDDDPPVNRYHNLAGPGFGYYESSQQGSCKHCNKPTNHWLVSIKEQGHYVCRSCDNARRCDNQAQSSRQ